MSNSPVSDLPYSRPLAVAEIPPQGLDLRLEPDAATRAALARHVEIVAVKSLEAVLHLAPERADGVHVRGVLRAEVTQTSVVSLESFEATVSEEVDVHFADAETAAKLAERADPEDDTDPPDVIADGTIDLGLLVTEFLSLGLDPYPRKPGEVFTPVEEGAAPEASPFAVLAQLKGKS